MRKIGWFGILGLMALTFGGFQQTRADELKLYTVQSLALAHLENLAEQVNALQKLEDKQKLLEETAAVLSDAIQIGANITYFSLLTKLTNVNGTSLLELSTQEYLDRLKGPPKARSPLPDATEPVNTMLTTSFIETFPGELEAVENYIGFLNAVGKSLRDASAGLKLSTAEVPASWVKLQNFVGNNLSTLEKVKEKLSKAPAGNSSPTKPSTQTPTPTPKVKASPLAVAKGIGIAVAGTGIGFGGGLVMAIFASALTDAMNWSTPIPTWTAFGLTTLAGAGAGVYLCIKNIRNAGQPQSPTPPNTPPSKPGKSGGTPKPGHGPSIPPAQGGGGAGSSDDISIPPDLAGGAGSPNSSR